MVLCVVVVLAGCGPKPPPAKPKPVDLTGGGAFKVIDRPSGAAYLVDANTKSCFLILPGRIGAGHVNCHLLKEKVKEAKSLVTWEQSPVETLFSGSFPGLRAVPPVKEYEGIKKIDDNTWTVSEKTSKDIKKDPDTFLRGARIVPSIRNGKPNGFKLYAIRPTSGFAALGLKNGDTVQQVNDVALITLGAGEVVYNKLKNSKRFTLKIERRGEKRTHRILVK